MRTGKRTTGNHPIRPDGDGTADGRFRDHLLAIIGYLLNVTVHLAVVDIPNLIITRI
jgi:hypothetical protein